VSLFNEAPSLEAYVGIQSCSAARDAMLFTLCAPFSASAVKAASSLITFLRFSAFLSVTATMENVKRRKKSSGF
jgi:hypothetical protein